MSKAFGSVCSVSTCNNVYGRTKGAHISYHKFPKDPKLRQAWAFMCKRNGDWNMNTARICSDHFSEDQFEDDIRARIMGEKRPRKLKPGAIPNVKFRTELDVKLESKRQKRLDERRRKKFVNEILSAAAAQDQLPEIMKVSSDTQCTSTAKQEIDPEESCEHIIEVTEVIMDEDEIEDLPMPPTLTSSACDKCKGIVKPLEKENKFLKFQVSSMKETVSKALKQIGDLKDERTRALNLVKEKEEECDRLKVKIEKIEGLLRVLCARSQLQQEQVRPRQTKRILVGSENSEEMDGKTEIRLC